MDSIDPTYPPFSPISNGSDSSSQGGGAVVASGSPGKPGPSSGTAGPPNLHSFAQLSSGPHQYSPTRAEIDSHPIRQRLSLTRDEITAGYGSAPEATSEDGIELLKPAILDSRQAQEGSERVFDKMSSDAPNVQEGDAVTYAWGSGQPGGVVKEVATNDSVTMETKNGNEVKKQGEPGNPALYIERDGHDVVKKASEVEVEEKGETNESAESEKKDESDDKKDEEPKQEEKKQENGEPQTGDKRPAEDSAEEKKDEETNGEAKAKKQKTDKPKANGEPKKKGRPAKLTDADGKPIAKKESKKRAPKKAATESGEPRRSGRNADK